jgi:hypothetical protein
LKATFGDLDDGELAALASESRKIASSLDDEGARLTVSLTADREFQPKLAGELQRETEAVTWQGRWTLSLHRRHQHRVAAAARAWAWQLWSAPVSVVRATRERPRARPGRCASARSRPPRHVRRARRAYASRRSRPFCLTSVGRSRSRASSGSSERKVMSDRGLLFEVAAELYDCEQRVSLSELLTELGGEDLDRVLYAIAVLKRRAIESPGPRRSLHARGRTGAVRARSVGRRSGRWHSVGRSRVCRSADRRRGGRRARGPFRCRRYT